MTAVHDPQPAGIPASIRPNLRSAEIFSPAVTCSSQLCRPLQLLFFADITLRWCRLDPTRPTFQPKNAGRNRPGTRPHRLIEQTLSYLRIGLDRACLELVQIPSAQIRNGNPYYPRNLDFGNAMTGHCLDGQTILFAGVMFPHNYLILLKKMAP